MTVKLNHVNPSLVMHVPLRKRTHSTVQIFNAVKLNQFTDKNAVAPLLYAIRCPEDLRKSPKQKKQQQQQQQQQLQTLSLWQWYTYSTQQAISIFLTGLKSVRALSLSLLKDKIKGLRFIHNHSSSETTWNASTCTATLLPLISTRLPKE